MARQVEIKIEGEDKILAAFDRIEANQQQRVRTILDNLADFGLHVLRQNVPVQSSYLIRHTDRTAVVWRPGGAGGGGNYEAVIGVKRGLSKHPFYVEFGTGLYGTVGWYIVPQKMPYMYFYSTKFRRNIRARRTRGQRPQRYLYTTYRELQVYAQGRLMSTDLLG